MHDELLNLLDNLEKPLKFSSGNSFSNLDKVKNLEQVVNDLCIRILSLGPPPGIQQKIAKIRTDFSSFESMDHQAKKELVSSTIHLVAEIRSVLGWDVLTNEKKKDSSGEITENNALKGSLDDLRDDIQYVRGIGPALKRKFSKKQVDDIGDLLFYFPRRYEDRRHIKKISAIKPGTRESVIGRVLISGVVNTGKRSIYNVVISDGSANLAIVWFRFNQKYLKTVFRKGSRVCVNGEIEYNRYERRLQIIHPNPEDVEILDETDDESKESLNFNRIVPIYPLTEGLTQKRIRNVLKYVTDKYSGIFSGVISSFLINRYGLMPLDHAVSQVHYPGDSTGCVDMESAGSVYRSLPHRTVVFFEFLVLELALGLIKTDVKKKTALPVNSRGLLEKKLADRLPFELTDAQKRVLNEIKGDLKRNYPMNRLLQGDVGSGKTVIAVMSMLNVVESGYQAVLMAPTEILAEQHMRSVCEYVNDLGIKVSMLRSSLGRKERENVYRDIETGKSRIIVGTHALIEDKVKFDNLGLVIVDEQHRFGVMQRTRLIQKAADPHVLVMTATPIPRTLAITVYGDLDISVIDELPSGRKKISTRYYKNTKANREKIYSIVREEIDKGRQVYFVCPMIESSGSNDDEGISYVTELYEEFKNSVFSDYRVGLLHGRMSADEKESTMNSFVNHGTDILVSTTVIEVGVDVPNASVMVIENAERFGLSQLHQLRGRIGRGQYESVCILVSSFRATESAEKKLRIMTRSEDGFVIAEEDLKIRGPGDFLGTKQSGIPNFRLASLMRDGRILSEARKAAFEILEVDPDLTEHDKIRKYIDTRTDFLGSRGTVT